MSLILLFAIATTTFYTGLLIQRCMDADSNIRTYPDIGEHAFGNKGRLIVSVFMYIELYLVATGFLILEGDNLQNLLPNVEFEVAGLTVGGKQGFIIIVALIILPSVWLDNLSLLSYVSASGVIASTIILGSIIWTGELDGIGFQQRGTLINWDGIPTAVSLYAFCYCAHPVFPTLYTSMKKRHQFSNVSINFPIYIVVAHIIAFCIAYDTDVPGDIGTGADVHAYAGHQFAAQRPELYYVLRYQHIAFKRVVIDLPVGGKGIGKIIGYVVRGILPYRVIAVSGGKLCFAEIFPLMGNGGVNAQGSGIAVVERVLRGVILLRKMGAVEATAAHLAVVIDVSGAVAPAGMVAYFIISAERKGGFMKISLVYGAIVTVGIIAAEQQSQFAGGSTCLYIHAFVAAVGALHAEHAAAGGRWRLCDHVYRAADGFRAVGGRSGALDDFHLACSSGIHFQQCIVVEYAGSANGDAVFEI